MPSKSTHSSSSSYSSSSTSIKRSTSLSTHFPFYLQNALQIYKNYHKLLHIKCLQCQSVPYKIRPYLKNLIIQWNMVHLKKQLEKNCKLSLWPIHDFIRFIVESHRHCSNTLCVILDQPGELSGLLIKYLAPQLEFMKDARDGHTIMAHIIYHVAIQTSPSQPLPLSFITRLIRPSFYLYHDKDFIHIGQISHLILIQLMSSPEQIISNFVSPSYLFTTMGLTLFNLVSENVSLTRYVRLLIGYLSNITISFSTKKFNTIPICPPHLIIKFLCSLSHPPPYSLVSIAIETCSLCQYNQVECTTLYHLFLPHSPVIHHAILSHALRLIPPSHVIPLMEDSILAKWIDLALEFGWDVIQTIESLKHLGVKSTLNELLVERQKGNDWEYSWRIVEEWLGSQTHHDNNDNDDNDDKDDNIIVGLSCHNSNDNDNISRGNSNSDSHDDYQSKINNGHYRISGGDSSDHDSVIRQNNNHHHHYDFCTNDKKKSVSRGHSNFQHYLPTPMGSEGETDS